MTGTPPSAGMDAGWAAATLDGSLRGAVLQGTALWQLVMIGAVVAAPETASVQLLLVALHLGVAALALLLRNQRFPLWPLSVALSVVLVLEWAIADSVDGALSFGAAWMCNLANLIPALLLRGKELRWASLLSGYAVPAGLAVAHPDWTGALVVPAIVTGIAIRRIGRVGVKPLRGFAERVDAETSAMWARRRDANAASAAARQSAEEARTLHDTAINTLAAVANGGAAIEDTAMVRERCASDLATLVALTDDGLIHGDRSLDDVLGSSELDVDRSGLDDDELAEILARCPADVVQALRGVLTESLRNVVKHAGTRSVEVHTSFEHGRLELVVADRGDGFDGRAVPGRGLAESVFARGEDAGIDVQLTTSPGSGTVLRFGYAIPEPTAPDDTGEDYQVTVASLRRRSASIWAAGVGAVGVVIEFVNRFGVASPTYGMLLVVALVGVVAWRSGHGGRTLGPTATLFVIGAVPASFLLALAGTDFGRRDLILWQCLGVSVPLVVLLVHGRGSAPVRFAVLALVTTAVSCAVAVRSVSPEATAVVLIGTAPPLGLLAAWRRFCRTLEQLGRRASAEQILAAQARMEHAARHVADAARQRWRDAGLNRCLVLLAGLADARLDPTDPEVRDACAEEERYLRQVMLLDPELYWSGSRFAGALALARSRQVPLIVRSGGTEVESEEAAERIGQLLQATITTVRPRATVTASLLSTQDGRLRFAVVAPAPGTAALATWSPPPGWTATLERFGDTAMIEVVRDPPAAGADEGPSWRERAARAVGG